MKNRNGLLALLISFLSIAACTKIITTEIGIGDLIPPVDGVTVKDTTLEVSINTYANTISRVNITETNVLGKYADTAFGSTNTSLYFQVQPFNFPFRFAVPKDSITAIDSVVLIIQTRGGFFGDSSTRSGFRIFEISDPSFDVEKGYPYNTDKSFITGDELSYNGSEQFINPMSVKDSIKAFGDTVGTPNQMRLRLNNSLGQRFVNLDTASYRTDSLFRIAFNGVKIVSTSGNTLFPVIPASSRIAIYYQHKKRSEAGLDTAVTYFSPSPLSASANNISVNRMGTQLENLPLGDTAVGSGMIYLQSGPGVYARLRIPGFENFPKMLIYRAELIMTEEAKSTINPMAPTLFISGVKDNKRMLLKDVGIGEITDSYGYRSGNYYTVNLPAFGSYPFARKDSIQNLFYYQYNFNVTRHFQDVNKGITDNVALDVFAPHADSVYAANVGKYVHILSSGSGGYSNVNFPAIPRIKILGNRTSNPHKIRLHMIYSPVN